MSKEESEIVLVHGDEISAMYINGVISLQDNLLNPEDVDRKLKNKTVVSVSDRWLKGTDEMALGSFGGIFPMNLILLEKYLENE